MHGCHLFSQVKRFFICTRNVLNKIKIKKIQGSSFHLEGNYKLFRLTEINFVILTIIQKLPFVLENDDFILLRRVLLNT